MNGAFEGFFPKRGRASGFFYRAALFNELNAFPMKNRVRILESLPGLESLPSFSSRDLQSFFLKKDE